MSDRTISESEAFENQVRALAENIEFPPTPDFATRVKGFERAPVAPLRYRAKTRWVAAALVLFALAGLLLVAPASESLARWFHLPGISIQIGDERQFDLSDDVMAGLGVETTLDESKHSRSFAILLPAGFTDPAAVFTGENPESAAFVYQSSDELPTIGDSRVGMLFVQFAWHNSDQVWAQKQLGADHQVRVVNINGDEGLWIAGTHSLRLTGGRDSRLAANVLLWFRDGVTYRIEAALPMGRMITIAESLVPVSNGTK